METTKSTSQILGTLGLQPTEATTQTQSADSISESQRKKRREWLDKWIKLNTFNDLYLLNLENAIYQFCAGYAKHPGEGRFLVIYGNNGVGKTHCAKAVVRWANQASMLLPLIPLDGTQSKVPDAQFVHWPSFLDKLKAGNWDLVDDSEEVALLVLDEIGGGYDPSQVGLDKLCRILSSREKKWTLITTNLAPDAWETCFDRRVASRLVRNVERIDLTGVPDYYTR